MASGSVQSMATSVESLTTTATGGTVKLVRSGKVRQLAYDDAVVPSAGYIDIPDMSSSDCPITLTVGILRASNGATTAVWIRPSGSIGNTSTTPGNVLSGTLTWIVP